MSRRAFWIPISALLFVSLCWLATRGVAQNTIAAAPVAQPKTPLVTRPHYQLRAQIDYDLLTFKGQAQITVPVKPGDAVRDAVFFLYANADGVGNAEAKHKNIVVDAVSFEGASVPFDLQGAVLRVKLPQAQRDAFELKIDYHGIVPRSAPSSGGLMDMMGGMDLGSLFGGATSEKPKNQDYGLYTYGNGILSLGSFWYPSLAVRQGGKWMDEAPEGLGDVGYAEMSDFDVSLDFDHMRGHPLAVAATGEGIPTARPGASSAKLFDFRARNVRDFAVLMSEDYVVKSKPFNVVGKQVSVEAYTLKKDAAQADKAIDVAGHALQIYAKRFGAYPYSTFKVVEGPIKGGAGGMEFSGMTSIASMLYGDLGKQLGDLAGSLGAGGLEKTLQGMGDDGDGAGATTANPAADMLQGLLGGQKEILDSLFEATIAHEVGHQWWAIGVGSDSQRAPWLDESLTNYSSMLYFEDRYGRAHMDKMMDAHLRQTYSMGRMIGGGDAPVNLETTAYKSNIQYGAIVYGKGALFYDALRREVGDDAFFGSLRQYFAEYNGKLAGPRGLRDIVEGRAPQKKGKIEALYARWIEQSHGDEDIAGGKVAGLEEMLGGLMGGVTDEQ